MSRANADFLRAGYEALERGDLETFTTLSRQHLAPDFEFHHVWDGTVLRGLEGTLEWLRDTSETWEDYHQEVAEVTDLGGDRVLVVIRISARGGGSGVPVAQELAVVWEFEGEKAVLARSYTSREEAVEAAGRPA